MPKKKRKPPPLSTWKAVERRLGQLFGACRRPLSGGNSKAGRDDCMHETLFLEAKLKGAFSLGPLYRATAAMAEKEKRIPVLGIQEKYHKGLFLCFNSQHIKQVCQAWAEANGYVLTKRKQ